MRILYFTININAVGGYSRIVIDKINWLASQGYDITICDVEHADVYPAYSLDERVGVLRGDFVFTTKGFYSRMKEVITSYIKMRSVIRTVNPDIIVNAHATVVTSLLLLVRKIPKVIELHQSRLTIEKWGDTLVFGSRRKKIQQKIRRWIYQQYDKVIVLTHEDQESWGLSNSVVIPNFTRFNKNQRALATLRSNSIVLVSRLVALKRIDLMIEIWARLADRYPQWEVKVFGDGPELFNLQKLIKEKGISSSFHLCGQTHDVESELQKASIFCFTSEYEGFGLVMIEAKQMGVPIIAFEYLGIHDLIENGFDGYIIPFGDVQLFVEKLQLLLDSKVERLRLRNNALNTVRKFRKEDVMHQWTDLFKTLQA